MTQILNIKTKKQDISFFESFLDKDIIPLAESIFDDGKIDLLHSERGNFEFSYSHDGATHKVSLTVRKNEIEQSSCSCQSTAICEHLAAALFFIRHQDLGDDKKSTPVLKKQKRSIKNFLHRIKEEELQHFMVSRMRSDRNLKTLVYARFLIQIEGIDSFQEFLDKSFPPAKTIESKPSQGEVRLFTEVVDEMKDQIIDLVGNENYLDAFKILLPLLKKSFYFKHRFLDVPAGFRSVHLKLVELINSLQKVIEAPALQSSFTSDIIDILAFSYVQFDSSSEKLLIVSQLDRFGVKQHIHDVLGSKRMTHDKKEWHNFLIALKYICNTNDFQNLTTTSASAIYMEVSSWATFLPPFHDTLLGLAQRSELPLRFKEQLLNSFQDDKQYNQLSQIAIDGIKEHHSLPMIKWLYQNNSSKWSEIRQGVMDQLTIKRIFRLVIGILIMEKNNKELFPFLYKHQDLDTYNFYLGDLIQLSRAETESLYKNWFDRYLSMHYGPATTSLTRQKLAIIRKQDIQLKDCLVKYLKVNYSKRPSLTTHH